MKCNAIYKGMVNSTLDLTIVNDIDTYSKLEKNLSWIMFRYLIYAVDIDHYKRGRM